MMDPVASTFYVRIEYNTVPTLHYLVNERHCYSWPNEKKCEEFYQANRLIFPITVGLTGLATTDDCNLNVIKLDNKIESISHIDTLHQRLIEKNSEYFCTIFSKVPVNITAKYLEFVHVNLFLKSKIQFGYTHTLDNFFKNDILIKFNSGVSGVSGKIVNKIC
jgi:hypothetical protein